MKKVIKTAVLLAVIISAILVAVGCSGGNDGDNGGLPAPGKKAPDFQLETVDGETVSLESLRGRPVLVNFWATWCGPCRIEIPVLQHIHETPEWRARGLAIIAINSGESAEQVGAFVEAFNMSFTILLDPGQETGIAYNARLIPTTYFIDKDGIIRDIKVGAILSLLDIETRLKLLVTQDES
jgi:cytochrome c biogenesis protein CcmG/thiol:disulfide interchange protein DsbE